MTLKKKLSRNTDISINKLADNMTARRKIVTLLVFSPNGFIYTNRRHSVLSRVNGVNSFRLITDQLGGPIISEINCMFATHQMRTNASPYPLVSGYNHISNLSFLLYLSTFLPLLHFRIQLKH
jgi:hypothetical protein